MSLTKHLKTATSPVRKFLVECAPALGRAGTVGRHGREAASALGFDAIVSHPTNHPIPPSVEHRSAHASVVGTAFDYRVRMALPGFDVYDTLAMDALESFEARCEEVPRGRHIHAVLRESMDYAHAVLTDSFVEPLTYATAAVPLAWAESIGRAGPAAALSGTLGSRIRRAKDAIDLMGSIDSDVVLDIDTLNTAVEPLLQRWKDEIEAGAPYVANPELFGGPAVGGADADLLVGDTLVELKTAEATTNSQLRETLLQLLGYTLLDLKDDLTISAVAIVLPRKPYFAVWELDELFGGSIDDVLFEARDGFAQVLLDLGALD